MDFRRAEIDHVIPQATPSAEFDALWARHARDTENNGVHGIANLRACCDDCNSTAFKGSIRFSGEQLDILLARSPGVVRAALKFQRKILQSGEFGKSVLVVASARTSEQYELLWDLDVSDALMAVGHRSSRALQGGRAHAIPVFTAPYQIRLATDGKSARLIAAMQLVSGLSASDLATSVVARAVAALDDEVWVAVASSREPIVGANAGTTDWGGASFTVSIGAVQIEGDVVSYSCLVEFGESIAVPVAAQSPDGSTLEDTQSELTVEGYLLIAATAEVGDSPRSSPRVDSVEVEDGDVQVGAA